MTIAGVDCRYLDHAAATPLRPQARAAMDAVAAHGWSNPSALHRPGRAARTALDDARESIAASFRWNPHEVIFTSGGTESANTALAGAPPGRRVVSAVEHKAVLAAAPGAARVPVGPDGIIDLDALAAALERDRDVSVVSVMAANNEVGAIQPIARVIELVREHAPQALVHTDAVHSAGHRECEGWQDADLVSLSSHKVGGPRGIGALRVRRGVALSPLLVGGAQEQGRRAGTEDAIAATGFAAALEAARAETACRYRDLADRFVAALGDGVVRNGPARRDAWLPAIISVSVPGCRAEDVLVLLDRAGISASSGSACASGAPEPSHVLIAMGRTVVEARSTLRFSLGWTTTEADVDDAAAALHNSIRALAGSRDG